MARTAIARTIIATIAATCAAIRIMVRVGDRRNWMSVDKGESVILENGKARKAATIIAVSAALLGVLFWDALGNLWVRWGEQQELSHSYFIPFISIWLVWTNRKAIASSVGSPSWIGVALLLAAGFLLVLGKLTFAYIFQHIALILAIAGLTAGLGGMSLLRVTAAPIAFLLFAVPPPYWVITVLSWNFQQISSVIGVWMIELMNIPVYLSGNIIDLGEYKLQVAEACSGLRYLFPFLSLGVMAAYIYRGPLWQKATIVAATLPITIIMNSFRIAVTGALVAVYGPKHAEGALHFFEGWVVFMICLVALFGVIWVLGLVSKPRRRNPLTALGSPELQAVSPSKGSADGRLVVGAAGGVLALSLVLGVTISTDSLTVPERAPFSRLPDEFPEMTANIRPIDPTIAEVINADDTIIFDLSAPEVAPVNLYLAYLETRGDRRSWHSPRQCIPGGGWQIADHQIREMTTPSGKILNYNRLIIQNRDQRELVYYWYDQRGRKVANEFVMKFWIIFDAVTRKRADGAMVRLITRVPASGDIDDADRRLQAMAARMDAFLPKYIPE
jgi:exosortase D (VPLPA-CTERM-specific)